MCPKVLFFIYYRLSKVLRNIISEEIKEQELSIRLVNPFLSGLVNDPDKDVLLRLTGLITVERKHRGITKKRPDITTTTLNIFNFGPSIGFDEVKQESKANNNHALSKYLIRVALFAKSSTNNNNIKGILTYNIVGRSYIKATTYSFILTSYIGRSAIFYINIVIIPFTVEDILKFTMDFRKNLFVLDIYETWCTERITPTECNPRNCSSLR
ncbi:hypothetical protein BDF21DRAFT_377731 [Thamnidium elegans]|nr:hypothetical protein BDF21DRAFT_377731 [Thamnidium elegans]